MRCEDERSRNPLPRLLEWESHSLCGRLPRLGRVLREGSSQAVRALQWHRAVESMTYHCVTCLGEGCAACGPEPWPLETWKDLTDKDVEQLICDSLDELKRRAELVNRLEWQLALPTLPFLHRPG